MYSSDLFRTMATAKAICELQNLTLITSRNLREICMGIWEDRTWGEVARNDGEQLSYFNHTSPLWHVEGGETFADVRKRVPAEILQIAARHPGQTIGIAGHGSAIRNTLAVFKGLSIEESAHSGHSDNTAVSLLEVEDGKVRVVFENDNSHLPEEISTLGRQKWWKHRDGSIVDSNMWFQPLDMVRDAKRYYEARKEAWVNIHGSLHNFDGDGFVNDALAHWRYDPRSVMCAMLGDNFAGILQMDFRRDADQGVGYIPFFYMTPEYRKQGLGIQLLGQAVSTYRPLNRTCLQLRCAPDNMVAQRFYQRHGFRKIREAEGTRVPLDIMQKYIGY
jgi:probable phosphoglycerate mutase